MSGHHFWVTEVQFCACSRLCPTSQEACRGSMTGGVISGAIHVIRGGLMCRGALAAYGPHKTLYTRFARWSRICVFDQIFALLAAASAATDTAMIDAGPLKVHRTRAAPG